MLSEKMGTHSAFSNQVFINLTDSELAQHAQDQDMVHISKHGAVVASTGQYTGRAVENRFIVRTHTSDDVDFGYRNLPFPQAEFDAVYNAVYTHLTSAVPKVYVQNSRVGADIQYSMNVQFMSDSPWHTLFTKNMFIDISADDLDMFRAEFTICHAPFFNPQPYADSLPNKACVLLNLQQKIIVIAGTEYAGEIKKSMFSVMNYMLPKCDVLPMHCSANMGKDGDTAIFFGLSGTGKTTLSADANRILIGDDEHGWTNDNTVFNIEGGCYAKAIGITADSEPEIFATTEMKNTVLENVILDDKGVPDFEDTTLTKNTRISYPIHFIPNASETGVGGIPKNIIMLTCDAFGVLPPVSRLTAAQANYQFLNGYTSKVAGTEVGIDTPEATFSTCFGAPFMPLRPSVYGDMLAEKIRTHNVDCWLVNTGWIGGAYGTGKRISLKYTRAIVAAILNGTLKQVATATDSVFGLAIPTACENVPSDVLTPENLWTDKDAYTESAQRLLQMFEENYKKYV